MPLAIVTGGNTGLGFETASALVAKGYQVLITSRSTSKGDEAVARISATSPLAKISMMELDLSSMESVTRFAASYAANFGAWDVLINNAGAKILPSYSETDFGVEYHYGVNAVGHFALTMDLLSHRADHSRVVSVASIIARFAPHELGPAGTKLSSWHELQRKQACKSRLRSRTRKLAGFRKLFLVSRSPGFCTSRTLRAKSN